MKTVDTKEYISMLRTLIEEGKQVSMIISGSSMAPFLIHARDHICLKSPSGELRKGDMVFYQRDTGQYVMHRIYQIRGKEYYMLGDAQTCVEGPLRREQIFALVVQVKRKGKILRPGNFWWEFFGRVWIRMRPLRPLASRLYGVFSAFRRKKIHR